jgi:hypothetical protein
VSRRPPSNTPHWQLTVRVFKLIAPRSWLKSASEQAGVVNGRDLRRSVDRDLTFEEKERVDGFLIDSLEQHIRDLDERRDAAANMIREILRAGNERSPHCEIEIPVLFDESAPERTLDELLVGDPLEALKRDAFADELAAERAELAELAA